jgi:methyltransferase
VTPGFLAFLVLLCLMGAARIAELLVARRLTQKASARGQRPKKEPIFVVMVVLHVLPFVLAPLEVIVFDRPFSPLLFGVSAGALLLLGFARVWTLRTLGEMWNVRIVQPSTIVVAGPYRYIRHPNYAVVILELVFLPLAHGCYLTLALLSALNAVVLFFRIRAEEAVLFALPGYAEQMGPKRRFVPGIF